MINLYLSLSIFLCDCIYWINFYLQMILQAKVSWFYWSTATKVSAKLPFPRFFGLRWYLLLIILKVGRDFHSIMFFYIFIKNYKTQTLINYNWRYNVTIPLDLTFERNQWCHEMFILQPKVKDFFTLFLVIKLNVWISIIQIITFSSFS